jgi:hypothetical protein
LLISATALVGLARQPASPQAAVDELLAADRAFAAAAATRTLVDALGAMFADEVAMPAPPGRIATGRAAAIEALRSNPENAASTVTWSPVRGGISADARHGFTFGYMTVTRPDGTRVPNKYLTYWVRQPDGWRAAAYKRVPAGEGEPRRDLMPPALPARLVAPSTDTAAIERHRQSLDAAERAFSDEAQRIGVGPAFAKHGSADAVNVGGPTRPDFLLGADAIGRDIGTNVPIVTDHPSKSPIAWAPDRVIVSTSGDLGVTIGMIRSHRPAEGQPAAFPFFTVWRRVTTSEPWKYVAE